MYRIDFGNRYFRCIDRGVLKNMKAIIFDFNGTLFWDTCFHGEAWNKIYKELHDDEDDGPDASFYCGPRNEVIIQTIAPWLSEEERLEVSKHKENLYRKICKENPHHVHLVNGAIEFLDKLKENKVPFILASASIKENIDFYFEAFGLERWFNKGQTVYDDGTYANKGEMHKEAAKRLGCDLSECVVIEDSISAIAHAKENGAGCIVAIGNEETKEKILQMDVEYFINDFTEIDFEWFNKKSP